MPTPDADPAASGLARRALLYAALASLIGSGLGTVGIAQGVVTGAQIPLILSCVVFSAFTLTALLKRRGPALQTIATIATLYFTLYLSSGSVIAIAGPAAARANLFVFLMWFFPLRVFNELVNAPAAGRLMTRCIVVAPVAVLAVSAPRLCTIFPIGLVYVLIAYCISYLGFATMFVTITRYREDFIAQRERTESSKVEAAILESISDCFISLDANLRLIYVNDAACAEFGVERAAALGNRLDDVVPLFCCDDMAAGLRAALRENGATAFEAPSRSASRWYEMRCFPRADGLSVYFRNVTLRRAADAKIEHLAFHDALTDLPNRALLRARLELALAEAARCGTAGALLFIDLDDFKTLNDTLGHHVGDAYLKEIAVRLTRCVRAQDTVARFGGDEFVVLLDMVGDDLERAGANAQIAAQNILAALGDPHRAETLAHTSTAAIGIALFAAAPDSADDLLKRADLAMYRAKMTGPNAVCFFDPAMQTLVAERAALLSDLRAALAGRDFLLYYQPQVDRCGSVIGAEALLRWHHPRRGMVPPSEFIALAEEAGLIVELGRWVLETACAQLARWSDVPALASISLAVNVSLRQFADADFVDVVLAALREQNADPRRLKLELTESCAVQSVDDTIAKMTQLRQFGIEFSIDDFGTGYSSLSHLKRLPLDQLKIDRSFVLDISTDNADASIVRTLVALGTSLGLSVIAEGVETAAQRVLLEREGCWFYQGFLYSPALPAAAFEAFVTSASAGTLLRA